MKKQFLYNLPWFCIILLFTQCNNNNNASNSQSNKQQTQKIEATQISNIEEPQTEQPASYIVKLKNRIPLKVDENLIFGEWEDQNSIVTYSKEYKFYGTFEKYQLEQQELGTFEILGDTLQMHFTSINHHPAYIISAINNTEFTIESLDDGAIFYKKKTK